MESLVSLLLAREHKVAWFFLAFNKVNWHLNFISVLRMRKLDLIHDFALRLWVLVLSHKLFLDCHKVIVYLLFELVHFDVCIVKILIEAQPRLGDIIIATGSFLPDYKGFELVDRIL